MGVVLTPGLRGVLKTFSENVSQESTDFLRF